MYLFTQNAYRVHILVNKGHLLTEGNFHLSKIHRLNLSRKNPVKGPTPKCFFFYIFYHLQIPQKEACIVQPSIRGILPISFRVCKKIISFCHKRFVVPVIERFGSFKSSLTLLSYSKGRRLPWQFEEWEMGCRPVL